MWQLLLIVMLATNTGPVATFAHMDQPCFRPATSIQVLENGTTFEKLVVTGSDDLTPDTIFVADELARKSLFEIEVGQRVYQTDTGVMYRFLSPNPTVIGFILKGSSYNEVNRIYLQQFEFPGVPRLLGGKPCYTVWGTNDVSNRSCFWQSVTGWTILDFGTGRHWFSGIAEDYPTPFDVPIWQIEEIEIDPTETTQPEITPFTQGDFDAGLYVQDLDDITPVSGPYYPRSVDTYTPEDFYYRRLFNFVGYSLDDANLIGSDEHNSWYRKGDKGDITEITTPDVNNVEPTDANWGGGLTVSGLIVHKNPATFDNNWEVIPNSSARLREFPALFTILNVVEFQVNNGRVFATFRK